MPNDVRLKFGVNIAKPVPKHWKEPHDQERVAFLLGHVLPRRERYVDGVYVISGYFRVPNVYRDCDAAFGVSKKSYKHATQVAADFGANIVGIMHSHPPHCAALPSESDVRGLAAFDSLIGLVVHPTGSIWAYRADGTRMLVSIDYENFEQ